MPASPAPASAPPDIRFRYVGATALTVRGPATARRYRFAVPNAEVMVDGRDAPAVAAVPHLVRVRGG